MFNLVTQNQRLRVYAHATSAHQATNHTLLDPCLDWQRQASRRQRASKLCVQELACQSTNQTAAVA